ncbi:MAG: P63C domain-containing protein [Candidatus Acidiferrales bacterium]
MKNATADPIAVTVEIFRLKGWNWNDGRMPPIVRSIVNDLDYSRLAPGVLEELKKRNPVTENGNRKNKHFQHLTADVGRPELTRHLYELIGMARAFSTGEREKYYHLVNRTFPKMNSNLLLPLEVGRASA